MTLTLYLVTVIYNYFGQKYSWNDAVTKDRLKKEEIPLPATIDGKPDWDYMDSYMKKVIIKAKESLFFLNKADSVKSKIDITGWKRFHLYDNHLFKIDMGNKLDKIKMTELNPTINFVGRANKNNGITTCVDKIKGIKPYPEGYMTLSLGGEYLGSCFIQPKPFYTSQNVIVLIPNENMNDNIKQFIATMIFRESRTKYKAFIDELNRHIKKDFQIYLPVTSTGEPDWQYMEDYMKGIEEKAKYKIYKLNKIS